MQQEVEEVEEFNKSLESLVQKKTVYYYAVARGYKIGIFLKWDECKQHTQYYSNALFKRFDNFESAKEFILNNMIIKNE